MNLFTPLTLPNGAVIPNRLAKAAMEENMADANHAPSDALLRLYQAWADGVGLILTGNVMVDGRAMTGPNGVVLERCASRPLPPLGAGGALGRRAGLDADQSPGRQMQAALGRRRSRRRPCRSRSVRCRSSSRCRRR